MEPCDSGLSEEAARSNVTTTTTVSAPTSTTASNNATAAVGLRAEAKPFNPGAAPFTPGAAPPTLGGAVVDHLHTQQHHHQHHNIPQSRPAVTVTRAHYDEEGNVVYPARVSAVQNPDMMRVIAERDYRKGYREASRKATTSTTTPPYPQQQAMGRFVGGAGPMGAAQPTGNPPGSTMPMFAVFPSSNQQQPAHHHDTALPASMRRNNDWNASDAAPSTLAAAMLDPAVNPPPKYAVYNPFTAALGGMHDNGTAGTSAPGDAREGGARSDDASDDAHENPFGFLEQVKRLAAGAADAPMPPPQPNDSTAGDSCAVAGPAAPDSAVDRTQPRSAEPEPRVEASGGGLSGAMLNLNLSNKPREAERTPDPEELPDPIGPRKNAFGRGADPMHHHHYQQQQQLLQQQQQQFQQQFAGMLAKGGGADAANEMMMAMMMSSFVPPTQTAFSPSGFANTFPLPGAVPFAPPSAGGYLPGGVPLPPPPGSASSSAGGPSSSAGGAFRVTAGAAPGVPPPPPPPYAPSGSSTQKQSGLPGAPTHPSSFVPSMSAKPWTPSFGNVSNNTSMGDVHGMSANTTIGTNSSTLRTGGYHGSTSDDDAAQRSFDDEEGPRVVESLKVNADTFFSVTSGGCGSHGGGNGAAGHAGLSGGHAAIGASGHPPQRGHQPVENAFSLQSLQGVRRAEASIPLQQVVWQKVFFRDAETWVPPVFPPIPDETVKLYNGAKHYDVTRPLTHPSVALHLYQYRCMSCPITVYPGKINHRPADVKLGGVCGDVPALCIAHMIEIITGVKIAAIDMFGNNLGRCNIWLENPTDVAMLTRKFDRKMWMSPVYHGYAVVALDDEGREFLHWYLEGLRAYGPKAVRFPRHLVTCERWIA